MIVGYTYKAKILCPECTMAKMSDAPAVPGADAEAVLDFVAGILEYNRADEHSFDQDDFPKVVTDQDLYESGPCVSCQDEGFGIKHCSDTLCENCSRELL